MLSAFSQHTAGTSAASFDTLGSLSAKSQSCTGNTSCLLTCTGRTALGLLLLLAKHPGTGAHDGMSAGSKGREGRCGQETDRTWCPAGSAGCSRQYTSSHGRQAQGKQNKNLPVFSSLNKSLVNSHFILPVFTTPALSLFALQQVSILPLKGTICSFSCTINLQCLMQDEAERHMIALELLTAAPTLSLVCCIYIILLHSKMAGCQSFRSHSRVLY